MVRYVSVRNVRLTFVEKTWTNIPIGDNGWGWKASHYSCLEFITWGIRAIISPYSWPFSLLINARQPLFWIRCEVWSKYENTVEVQSYNFTSLSLCASWYRPIFFTTFQCRWKGSTYRLIWKEFLIYMAVYLTISIIYDFVLDDLSKKYRLFYSIAIVIFA